MKSLPVIILFIFSLNAFSQYPNYRIHPSSNPQIEPSIIHHPTNPLIIFASAFTISGALRSEGIYVSTNGGVTWFGNDTCMTGVSTTNHGGDPGPIIDKNGRFIITHQGGPFIGMYSNYSDNLGGTWTENVQIASGDQDKGTPATDDASASPFYGRTFLAWTRYTSPFPIVLSYTTNGGVSWSAVIQINTTPVGHLAQGADIRTGPNGEIYVCWASTLQNSPANEDFCGFGKSTNGGVNWTVNENIFDMNGVKTSTLTPWNIRINGYPRIEVDRSGGSRNGWIYIVTGEKNIAPAGTDPDIILHRSTDGGTTWSSGIRVNQDALNNGKIQYFGAVHVDEGGGVNVLYYDNRIAPGDSMGVYISHSVDGGNTWFDQRINQSWFRPHAVSGTTGGNQGDNIGMSSGNGKLFPLWMADYTGIYQIWAANIDYSVFGIKQISTEVPSGFKLFQNYPNPFNPSTKIKFDIRKSNVKSETSNVKLIIYNILGGEITTLVNQALKAGSYEVNWDASNFPSGIYYCQLTSVPDGRQAGNYSESKKMILLR